MRTRRLTAGTAFAAATLFLAVTFALPLYAAILACGMSCCEGAASPQMAMPMAGCCADACEMRDTPAKPERPDAALTESKVSSNPRVSVALVEAAVAAPPIRAHGLAFDVQPRAPDHPIYLRNSVLII